jgi:hypothetical protein
VEHERRRIQGKLSRLEALKLIGAGNAAGAAAVGVYLTSGLHATLSLSLPAKLCFLGFFVGMSLSSIMYFMIFQCESCFESAIYVYRDTNDLSVKAVQSQINEILYYNDKSGKMTASAICCFGLGMVFIFGGVIFFL